MPTAPLDENIRLTRRRFYAFIPVVSAALTLPIFPTLQPDPGPADRGTPVPAAPAAATPQPGQPHITPAEPSPIGRVIAIVRWLIGYGTMLATAVRDHPTEPLARSIVYWFLAPDPDVVLRRLTRGLIRAAALEAWLRERAAGGRELRSPPIPLPSPRKPRSGPPAAPPAGDARPAPWWQDPDHVPTKEEAAAEVRNRHPGVVMAGVSEDFGVLNCALDPSVWAELRHAIDSYGGDNVRFWIRNMRRRFDPARRPESWAEEPPPIWQSPPLDGWMPAPAHPP